MVETYKSNNLSQKSERTKLQLSQHFFDVIFNEAPIMVHGIDQDLKIVKVNPRWLERMGYEEDEVIGHRTYEFLEESSRTRAIAEVFPLLRRLGSCRSIGMQFKTSDGQTFDGLVNAEVTDCRYGNVYAYAAIYDAHNHEEWEQAATTMKALREISRIQCAVADGTLLGGDEKPLGVIDAIDHLVESPAYASNESPHLTIREREVLGLLASGASNRQIAERLIMATRTVRFHIENLFHKLGVQNRIQAVLAAAERGLVTL